MNLEEALKMATNTTVEPVVQDLTTPVAQAPVMETQQVQATAQVVQPTVTTAIPVQQSVVQQPVAQQPASTGIDLDQSSQDVLKLFSDDSFGFGQVRNTRVIDPVRKMDKGESFRFTIIGIPKPCSLPTHKTENFGKVLCTSTPTHLSQCCKDLGEPKPRYFVPVVIYSTMPKDPRTALPQGKSELKLLVLWDNNSWTNLFNECLEASTTKDQFGNPVPNIDIDLIATSDDSYGKLSFRGQKDSFRSIPEYQVIVNDAKTKWEQIKDRAYDVVCKMWTEEQYIQHSRQASQTNVPQMSDYTAQDIY